MWLRDVILKRLDLLLLILSLEKRNLEPRRARKLGTARKQRPPDYNRAVESDNNQSEQEKAFSPGALPGRNTALLLRLLHPVKSASDL